LSVEQGQWRLSLNKPFNVGELRPGPQRASMSVPKLRRETVDLHFRVLVVGVRSDRPFNDLARDFWISSPSITEIPHPVPVS
jgi:hypothetical protein